MFLINIVTTNSSYNKIIIEDLALYPKSFLAIIKNSLEKKSKDKAQIYEPNNLYRDYLLHSSGFQVKNHSRFIEVNCLEKRNYRRVSIVVLNKFLRVSRKFEKTVTPPLAQVRILSWNFFPYTIFIHFIKFSSAVEMSSSIQNFSPIIFFFCNRN
jgi:hypothetical protein